MPHGGNSYTPAQTQSYFFHYIISSHTRFFFDCAGAKKKLTKRNAVKEMRKGGFLKKAPFKSPKNFLTTDAGMLGVCTQSSAPVVQPRRRRFLKKAPS